MKLYLCGPILGCNDSECNDWRKEVRGQFPYSLDPMRRDYRGKELANSEEIVKLDTIDILNCDAVIANCPQPSVGTSMEILIAYQLNKEVVTIVPDINNMSPWLKHHSTHVYESLLDAINYFKGK